MGLIPSFCFSAHAIISAMSFIDKVKEIVTGFLASQSNKYITTEGGLKIQIMDRNFQDESKASAGVWSEKAEAGAGSWNDKTKTS